MGLQLGQTWHSWPIEAVAVYTADPGVKQNRHKTKSARRSDSQCTHTGSEDAFQASDCVRHSMVVESTSVRLCTKVFFGCSGKSVLLYLFSCVHRVHLCTCTLGCVPNHLLLPLQIPYVISTDVTQLHRGTAEQIAHHGFERPSSPFETWAPLRVCDHVCSIGAVVSGRTAWIQRQKTWRRR